LADAVELRRRQRVVGTGHPGFELALRWVEDGLQVPSTQEATSLSMSSRLTILPATRARPRTHAPSAIAPRSGVALMFSGVTLYTSDTASTTMPAVFSPFAVCQRTTITTVELSGARCWTPNRVRRSITGTITPRRFMTPSRYGGVYGTRVTPSQPLIS